MTRIVVAPDSFKGSLDAPRAAEAMRRGIAGVVPDAEIRVVPLADGGEGTAEVLRRALGGRWLDVTVNGPRAGTLIEAGYVRLEQPGSRVVVEMARASGLALLRTGELDPLMTTTRGTGELLAAALTASPASIWLAAGGSATVDGGVGAARALGWRFLDEGGEELAPGGGALVRLRRIVAPEPHPVRCEVTLLADVANPLVGPRGAARVFAPQKGADDPAVARLEEGLETLAERIREDLGVDVSDLPGGGAAGGLGAGAVAFLGAAIRPGVDEVMRAVGLAERLANADWVVTGEGRLDAQSLGGKVVSGVARVAREQGVRVAVLTGRSELPPAGHAEAGFDAVVEAAPRDLDVAEAMSRADQLVQEAAATLAREALR